MADLVERTAKSPFTLSGQPVAAGQIVTLDPVQLEAAVAAGCVARSASENALVPTAGLPPLRSEVPGADLTAARAAAQGEIAALQDQVQRGRTAAAQAVAEAEAQAKARLDAIQADLTTAEAARDARLAEIRDTITRAEADRDARLAALTAEAEGAEKAAETKARRPRGEGNG